MRICSSLRRCSSGPWRRRRDPGFWIMYGRNIPSIDGFGRSINLPLVKLMKELISYPPKVVQKTSGWFADTIAKGYFDGYYGE